MAHSPDIAAWLERQLTRRQPGGPLSEEMAVQSLADTLEAVRGKSQRMIFGASPDSLEGLDRQQLDRQVLASFHAWKAHYEEVRDEAGLRLLSGQIGHLEPSFQRELPAPPASFGDRSKLDAAWQQRLARVDELIAGKRRIDLEAIDWVGRDDVPEPEHLFGEPSPPHLYALAQYYEQERGAPFPAEVIAFFLTLGSLTLDEEDPVLEPVIHWEFIDEGLRIGCGGYIQGSLTLDGDLADGPVVDRDDDGIERKRYPSFAAFVDALLGAG